MFFFQTHCTQHCNERFLRLVTRKRSNFIPSRLNSIQPEWPDSVCSSCPHGEQPPSPDWTRLRRHFCERAGLIIFKPRPLTHPPRPHPRYPQCNKRRECVRRGCLSALWQEKMHNNDKLRCGERAAQTVQRGVDSDCGVKFASVVSLSSLLL